MVVMMRSTFVLLLVLYGSLVEALKVGIITEDAHVPASWHRQFPRLQLLAITSTNHTSLTDAVCEALEKGAKLVVDATSQSDCALLKHASVTFAVPVLFTSGCATSPTTLSLSTSASETQAILYDVAPLLRWGSSGIITDKLSDVSATLLRSLSSQGRLQYYWEGTNYLQGLSQLRNNSVYRILVSIPPAHVPGFITATVALNLDQRFSFFFTTPMKKHDLQDVHVVPNNQRNAPSMYAVTYPQSNYDNICTRDSLSLDALSLINASMDDFPNQKFKDFPISCQEEKAWNNIQDTMKYLSNIKIEGYTGEVKFEEGERILRSLHINDIRINKDGDASVTDLGEWRKDKGVLKRSKRSNGGDYIVTTIISEPFMMEVEGVPLSSGNAHFEGFLKDLLDEIADKVGYTYRIRLVRDGQYGSLDPDTGRWNGMIGELLSGEADIAAAPLTHTTARNNVVDFTKGFLVTGLSALFLKPGSSISGSWVFLSPFSAGLWLCILAAWLLTSLALYIIGRVTPYEELEEDNLTVQSCLWYTLTSMLFRNWIPLKAPSTRFLLTLWWWFSLIMLILYASLSAFLFTNSITDPPMIDAKDLLDSGLPFGTLSSGSSHSFFKVSKKDIHQKMAARMSSPQLHEKSYNDGIARVKRGDYAFIMETAGADYAISQDCSLARLPTQIHSRVYGLALPRGSENTERISHAILELEETGSIAALYDKWWSQDKECGMGLEGDTHLKKINVFSVGGVLITFLLGLIVSVCLGFGEKFYAQFRGKSSGASDDNTKSKKTMDIGEQFRQLTNRDRQEGALEEA